MKDDNVPWYRIKLHLRLISTACKN